MAYSRLRRVILNLACIRGGKGVDVAAVSLVEAVKRVLPQNTVAAALQKDIAGVGNLVQFTIFILCRVKTKIRFLQRVGDIFRGGENLSERGQKLFLIGSQRMRLFTQKLYHRIAVVGEQRIVCDFLQLFLWQSEHLRLRESRCRHCLHIARHGGCVHFQRILCSGIFAFAEKCIFVNIGKQELEIGFRLKILTYIFSIIQAAAKRSSRFDLLIEQRKLRFPVLIILKKRGQIPCKSRIHLFSFF